jgi:hypothetical protein
MKTSELVNQWKNGLIKEGVYTSYVLDGTTNIIVEVENECVTFKFLEGKFTRCETYYKDGTVEEWFN